MTGGDRTLRGVVRFGQHTVEGEAYALTPPQRPRLLVPAGFPLQAMRSMAAFGHHRPRSSGARAMAARVIAQPWTPKWTLSLENDDGPVARSPMALHLADLLEVDEVVLALRAVIDRPNAKPVVIAMSADGDVLAFCKVGWDELTTRLVHHEGEALDRVRQERTDGLQIPETVFAGAWSGLELLVTRPVDTDHQPVALDALVTLACRLAEQRSTGDALLGASSRVVELIERAGAVRTSAPPRIADGLDRAVAALLSRWGDRKVRVGPEHGDFVPTNVAMAPDGETVVVWDWERSTAEAPVGLDAAHAVVAHMVRRGDVFDRLLPVLSDLLTRSCGPAELAAPLVLIDLIEMVLRHEEAREARLACEDPGYGRNLLEMLRYLPN